MLTWKWFFKLLLVLVSKPSLWTTSIRQVFLIAKRRWLLTLPFLPSPSRDFMEFRFVTYQGHVEKLPDVKVVIAWLAWVSDIEKSKI